MSKIIKKIKEQQYRLLNAGERLKLGDSVYVAAVFPKHYDYWRDIIPKFVGKVVEPHDPPIRRPIKR